MKTIFMIIQWLCRSQLSEHEKRFPLEYAQYINIIVKVIINI